MVRMAAAGLALAAVTALAVGAVAERAAVATSFAVLGHLHWLWIPAALLLESVSMAAFAIMLRRLLAAGGASVGVRPMLATAYAANAVSVSVPLAGPALATAFTFRRFTRQGADAPLAGWSLLAGGVISSATAALIVVAGGLASGNILVTAVTVPGGVLALAVLVAAVVAVRRPRLRDALERPAEWMLRQGSRMIRRPAADPGRTIRGWAQRLGSLQLPRSGWMTATGLALANWLADAAVLAVSIRATGATVVPFETARLLARALPDVRLQLVEGAGHHLPRRASAVVADAIVAFLAAAQINDISDHSVSRDVNSSRVLSVLGGRAGARRAPVPGSRMKGRYRWQIPVTTVRTASQPGRGEARSPRCAPASGLQPNGPPASTPKHAGSSWRRSRP